MTHIQIDRRAKTMELELELEGESSPIHIRVDQYTFEKPPEGPAQISVKGIHISRMWMQLLSKFAEGRKVPIPAEVAEYAGLIL